MSNNFGVLANVVLDRNSGSASNDIGHRLIAGTQVAGVLATAWFVWINAILPRLGLRSLASIAAEAMLYVMLAWICGAAIAFSVYFVVSLADLPRVTRFSLRASAAAMWYAPAIVLLSAPSASAFAVSIFLVVNATRHLFSQWGAIESPIDRMKPARTPPALLFGSAGPDTAFLLWSPVPVLLVSFTAQAGVVAMLWRHEFRAAVLLAMSTAILTSLAIARGAYRPAQPPALPHSALSVVLTFLLAVALTFGGFAVRRGGGAVSQAASDSSNPAGQPAKRPFMQLAAPPIDAMGIGGDFPGVILLPELKPYTTLFVPLVSPPRKFGAPALKPVGIPFSGEYWMFRWPATRPPQRSVIRRGSASELSFRTTDGVPIEMEAYQKLDAPFDITCCREIQLAIVDADHYPGTVSLELILIDTTAPKRAQSLGTVEVGGGSSALNLRFSVPRVTALRKFDQLKVVFHRRLLRADKSARIAIERFVFLP